jgi:MFS family permease
MILGFAGLAATNPATNIGTFAIFAVIAALASATQDVAIDAWRIDVSDEQTPVELLSAIYQFGYRIASIVGGALSLVLAARMSWSLVYLFMGGLVAIVALIAFRAPDTPRPDADRLHKELSEPGAVEPRVRMIALALVGIAWAWAIFNIGRFMVSMLAPADPNAPHPSVADFTKAYGPWIIFATVIVPLIVAALLNWMKERKRFVEIVERLDDRRGDRHCFLFVRGIDVGKGLQFVPPAFSCSIAASTLCGCSGRLRIVAPVALRTALAIADAVDTVGGSPMPITPRSGMLLSTMSICGTSDMPASMYHSMFGLTICPVLRSSRRSSNSAKLIAAMTPP